MSDMVEETELTENIHAGDEVLTFVDNDGLFWTRNLSIETAGTSEQWVPFVGEIVSVTVEPRLSLPIKGVSHLVLKFGEGAYGPIMCGLDRTKRRYRIGTPPDTQSVCITCKSLANINQKVTSSAP